MHFFKYILNYLYFIPCVQANALKLRILSFSIEKKEKGQKKEQMDQK